MPDRSVVIRDNMDQTFRIQISTPNLTLLAYEMWRAGNFQIFRPSYFGGTWSASDFGMIKYTSGLLWYKRSSVNMTETANGIEWGDLRYIDVFLYSGNEDTVNGFFDWGILLAAFYDLNSWEPGAGDANIGSQWALQIQPGIGVWSKEGSL